MKARFTPALFAHAEQALNQVLRFEHPADAVVSHYFREHRELGHADRGFVAETLFAVLRRKRSLEFRCGMAITPRKLLFLALVMLRGWNQRELQPVLKASEDAWLSSARGMTADDFPPAVRSDLPDWLYEALERQFGADEVATIAYGLNQPAPLDLRINPLKVDRNLVLARLGADGIRAETGSFSPLALRLLDKPALARHPLFLEGSIEVQDEGSQLLGLLVAPKRGELVVDFCAGAGGKTLLLGALMKNTGRLYAFDVSDQRLTKLKPRLARSGLSNVHPLRIEHERDAKIKRLSGKADRVLVDAPCSGLGTLRRNPDLKWRQNPQAIAELTAKQAAILNAAAGLVRPGGRLIYATCSPLEQENDRIVDHFLSTHADFAPLAADTILAKQGIDCPGERLRLLPHRHGSDGFFATVLERNL